MAGGTESFPIFKRKKSTAIKEKATAKKTSDFLNK
jgi:hypothetical protein